jgi:hypothetical protein
MKLARLNTKDTKLKRRENTLIEVLMPDMNLQLHKEGTKYTRVEDVYPIQVWDFHLAEDLCWITNEVKIVI